MYLVHPEANLAPNRRRNPPISPSTIDTPLVLLVEAEVKVEKKAPRMIPTLYTT